MSNTITKTVLEERCIYFEMLEDRIKSGKLARHLKCYNCDGSYKSAKKLGCLLYATSQEIKRRIEIEDVESQRY